MTDASESHIHPYNTLYFQHNEPQQSHMFRLNITEDGVTLSYEITNKKIPPVPEEPESPKTGDDSLGILLLVALVALIALGYLVMNARNSKNMIKKEG